jgi:hypothetical protein
MLGSASTPSHSHTVGRSPPSHAVPLPMQVATHRCGVQLKPLPPSPSSIVGASPHAPRSRRRSSMVSHRRYCFVRRRHLHSPFLSSHVQLARAPSSIAINRARTSPNHSHRLPPRCRTGEASPPRWSSPHWSTSPAPPVGRCRATAA